MSKKIFRYLGFALCKIGIMGGVWYECPIVSHNQLDTINKNQIDWFFREAQSTTVHPIDTLFLYEFPNSSKPDGELYYLRRGQSQTTEEQ